MNNKLDLQERYNEFCIKTNTSKQDELCGNLHVFEIEKFIINKLINPKKILDVGCGTGHRMFDYYSSIGIKFKGVEKFQNLINDSRYSDLILQDDVLSTTFFNKYYNRIDIDYDLVVCFGGVVNGFLNETSRVFGWLNLIKLAKGKCPIVISILSNQEIFESSENGKSMQFDFNFPHQYLYSRREIFKILKDNNIKTKFVLQEYLNNDLIIIFLVLE